MNQELGKYKILEELGEGATAEVYHAIDTGLDRQVALKVLKPALVPDPSAFARFVQEAKAAARLFHNHVATVLDMGDAEGRYFIAMRYIEGESLDKILKEEGPLSWKETLRMAGQIGEALDYAHGEGFLHRDVKPSNILRDGKGDFWLTDFGLTRAMMSTGLTSHTGAVLGTPAYIAPEIWQGEDAVPATDQYALACVVYQAVTGDVLFQGDTPPAVMTGHVLNGPDLPGGWPESLNDCIAPLRKALSKDPTDRYDSISIYANKLGRKKTPEQKRARLEAEHKAQLEAEEKVSREREIAAQEDEERSEGSDQPIAESRKLKTPWWQDWRVWVVTVVIGIMLGVMYWPKPKTTKPTPAESHKEEIVAEEDEKTILEKNNLEVTKTPTAVPTPTAMPTPTSVPIGTNLRNSKYNYELYYSDAFSKYSSPIVPHMIVDSIEGLELIDEHYFSGTNLRHVQVGIGASSDSSVVSSCMDYGEDEIINSIPYKKVEYSEVATGTVYRQISYRTLQKGTCYEIGFVIAYGNMEMYEKGSVAEFDESALLGEINQLLSTFSIMEKN